MPPSSLTIAIDVRPLTDGNSVRGIGSYVRNLLIHLSRIDPDNRYLLLHEPNKTLPAIELPKNAELVSLNGIRNRLLSKRDNWIWESYYLSRLLRHHKADLFHATYLSPPLFWSIPRVSTCYDFIPLKFPGPKEHKLSKRIRNRLAYHVSLQGLKSSAIVIAISEFTQKEAFHFLKISPDKSVAISLGVSTDFQVQRNFKLFSDLSSRYGFSAPIALYVGGVDSRKNVESLISCSMKLLHEMPNSFQLVIVGSINNVTEDMEKKIAAQGFKGQIIFTGHLSNIELINLYNHSRIFCFPSLEEGFGLPVLEAMACGLPVIAYECDAVREVAKDAACLVKDTDIEFRKAIQNLLTDETEWHRLHKAGLARACDFTWDKTAKLTLTVYTEIVGKK